MRETINRYNDYETRILLSKKIEKDGCVNLSTKEINWICEEV